MWIEILKLLQWWLGHIWSSKSPPLWCRWQVTIKVEQWRPGNEEMQPLDCLCLLAAWVCGARTGWSFMCRLPALSHSFLLPFSLSFSLSLFFLFSFSFFISLSFFSFFLPLFFSSKPGLTPSWNKDTPLDGWNLKHDAMRFPPHLDFVWKSSVQCRGLLLSVFHSKEHQSVQLMQSLCSQASYVPWNG